MNKVKTIFCSAALTLGCLSAVRATPPLDLHLGHFEAHIDYALTPGNPDAGWQFSVSYDPTNNFTNPDGVVRLDPANTTIVATPEAAVVLMAPFHGLGNTGDTLWVLPQANREGRIFLGWRTVIPAGIFQRSINGFFQADGTGNIVLELVQVAGPGADAGGAFAMWESKSTGGVEMHFNSADGIDANDRLEPVIIGSHTHYNWALSRPGNYAVTFRALGRLNPWQPDGGQNTSQTATFHFAVPFSSVATAQAELRLALDEVPAAAAIHPQGEPVEYAPGQVALVTRPAEVGDVLRPYVFQLHPVPHTAAAEAHRVGIPGGLPVAFPPGATLSADPLEVLQMQGPGNLDVMTDNGSDPYFVFSDPGIYRVRMRAVGMQGATPALGPAFELVFLAGLEADYDFAAWADSFERTHGIAPGSLQPDGSDWDGDSIPDIIEYQLFWEGFDPVVADAENLPLPSPANSEALLVFHRDTYKDRLDRRTQNIVLEHSPDLASWFGWSDRNTGYPLEQYESGAELGNAYARIQRRALRLPAPVPGSGFFRWRIDPAQ